MRSDENPLSVELSSGTREKPEYIRAVSGYTTCRHPPIRLAFLGSTFEGAHGMSNSKARVTTSGLAVVSLIVGLVAVGSVAMASPPSGVTPTVLSRGKYDAFKMKPSAKGSVDFEAKADAPLDIIVRQHDYAPGSTTGWHSHPGPVFITVTKGQLTFYEADDPTCKPHVVSAGQGYQDTGHGHIGRNETGEPAQDVSVIIAPVGGVFRSELPAPGQHCKF